MSKIKRIILSLFLCACIVMSGSVNPLLTYASLADDEYVDIEDAEADGDEAGVTEEEEEENDVEQQYSGQIDQLGDKIKALEEESKKLQAGLNATATEKERAIAEVNAIGRQISITQEQIAALMERIDYLEKDISSTQSRISKKVLDIEKKQVEIDESYAILRKRLRASYMQDTTTTLGLIFGVDNFSDFLTRIEYVQRIAQHDKDLLAELTEQRQGLEAQKVSLEDEIAVIGEFKKSVEEDKQETESKKDLLGTQIGKAQSTVQNLDEMERAYRADLANNKKIQDAAKAELDRIYREIEWSKNKYSNAPMAFPIPAYPIPGKGYVSCEVGPRFGGTDVHSGIDLSGTGIRGSNVVAVNDGTVVKTNWSHSPGRGYGIYIIIDHGVNEKGQSVSTLYAHLDNIYVKEGQEVKRGEAIGQVGSTGWSTGPHLHLEVRLNGSWVNPRPYLFG